VTLPPQLDWENYETLSKWVDDVAKEVEMNEETLWNIVEKMLLEPTDIEKFETEAKLKVLLDIHLHEKENRQQTPASWVNIYLPKRQVQFSFGQFSVDLQSDKEMEAMKKLTREEDLNVAHMEEGYIATEKTDGDAIWALRILQKITQDVYGFDLQDIRGAEEDGREAEGLTLEDVAKYR
jgi:hypothetical protein